MPNHKRFWYVASPYSSKDENVMEERYDLVVDFCAFMARAGEIVYSPIAHWHPIACFHDLPRDAGFWQAQDRAMIVASEGIMVLMIEGWKESKGVQDEIKFAHDLQRRIQYWSWDGEVFAMDFQVQKER